MVYLGRVVAIGMSRSERPFALYAVSGRSEESRARKATILPDRIYIGPLDGVDSDPLRHYAAIGVPSNGDYAVVGNGRHTNEIARRYAEERQFAIGAVLNIFGPEPDRYRTPRIVALFDLPLRKAHFGIISSNKGAVVFEKTGDVRHHAIGLPTYLGDFRDRNSKEVVVNDFVERGLNLFIDVPATGKTAQRLADDLFDWLDRDLAVCTAAAMCTSSLGGWEFAVRNLHGD